MTDLATDHGDRLQPGPLAGEGPALAHLLAGTAAVRRPESYAATYPPRDLPPGAMVTRFAPSPTGFMHIGGIFVSIINKQLAEQSGGVFFLRIEDTDTKRAIEGALDTIVDSLARYGLTPHEGLHRDEHGALTERGAYGPYTQTERCAIYRDHALSLVQRGLAYPCFATVEEIDAIRQQQTAAGANPGVHGRWAPWRDAPVARVEAHLRRGVPYVVRLRAPDDASGRIAWTDGVKGKISMPQNPFDTVLLKSDGIPTYHFAHAVDDHLMRTTHVIRGDEWISSMPIHLQLFAALEFPRLQYAHIPPIQKIEQRDDVDAETGTARAVESRRKLSKRKDPEANVEFYQDLGVPEAATIEYLLNIANSAFEEWRTKNPRAPYGQFPLKLAKLSAGGALSDVVKLKSISKQVISAMTADEVYPQALAWATEHDPALAALMQRDPAYTKRALGIERDSPKGNKRIVTWQDLRPQLAYFYDEAYRELTAFDFPPEIAAPERSQLLQRLRDAYDPADAREAWLDRVRAVATAAGYAGEVKQFKAAPTAFKGHIGDVVMLVRVAVCGTRQSPDLYDVMQVLGAARVRERLGRFC